MNAKDLLDKGFTISKDIRFGKISKSEKPKVVCPKCESSHIIHNGITMTWTCSKCGNVWGG